MSNGKVPVGYVNTPIQQQYVGARYVPVFADPIDYNPQMTYEQLVIVNYLNQTYVSKRVVPPGNYPGYPSTDYWLALGNTNAQYNQVLQEIADLTDELSDTKTSQQGVNANVQTQLSNISTDLSETKTTQQGVNASVQTQLNNISTDLSETKTTQQGVNASVQTQLNSVASGVKNATASVRRMTGATTGKIIFISGSYGTGEGNFIEKCASHMRLDSSQLVNLSVSGHGFTNNNFYNDINTWITNNPDKLLDVSAVVVCCSTNDLPLISTNQAALYPLISNCYQLCANNFPNAILYACCVGFGDSTIYPYITTNNILALIHNLMISPFVYLSGVDGSSHNLMDMDDGLHPNADLAYIMGVALANALQTGMGSYNHRVFQNIPDGDSHYYLKEEAFNGINNAVGIFNFNLQEPMTVASTTWVTLTPLVKPKLKLNYFIRPAAYTFVDGTTNTVRNVNVRLDQSGLAIYSPGGSFTFKSVGINICRTESAFLEANI